MHITTTKKSLLHRIFTLSVLTLSYIHQSEKFKYIYNTYIVLITHNIFKVIGHFLKIFKKGIIQNHFFKSPSAPEMKHFCLTF